MLHLVLVLCYVNGNIIVKKPKILEKCSVNFRLKQQTYVTTHK
jgi:hypothetical protein